MPTSLSLGMDGKIDGYGEWVLMASDVHQKRAPAACKFDQVAPTLSPLKTWLSFGEANESIWLSGCPWHFQQVDLHS